MKTLRLLFVCSVYIAWQYLPLMLLFPGERAVRLLEATFVVSVWSSVGLLVLAASYALTGGKGPKGDGGVRA
jgi:hypothetical protein